MPDTPETQTEQPKATPESSAENKKLEIRKETPAQKQERMKNIQKLQDVLQSRKEEFYAIGDEIIKKREEGEEIDPKKEKRREQLRTEIENLEKTIEFLEKSPDERRVEMLTEHERMLQRYGKADRMRGMLGEDGDFEAGLKRGTLVDSGRALLILGALAYGAYRIIKPGDGWLNGRVAGVVCTTGALMAAHNVMDKGQTHTERWFNDTQMGLPKLADKRMEVLEGMNLKEVAGKITNRIEHEDETGTKSIESVIKEKDQRVPDRFTELELRAMLPQDADQILAMPEMKQIQFYREIVGGQGSPGLAEMAGRKVTEPTLGGAMDEYGFWDPTMKNAAEFVVVKADKGVRAAGRAAGNAAKSGKKFIHNLTE